MAWTWVKTLKNKNTGDIMDLIVPVGFTFTGIGMTSATHEYQQYNTAHPEYETHVKAIALQEVDPLLNGADKVGTTYAYAANGGGLTITQITRQSANRNQVTWYIKDLWGNTKVNGYQCMMATDAQYNTYVTDNVKCGFCAAVNDETEQMFFGYVVSYHGTYTNDPWYYSWRIDLHMYAYDNNNNVYSIFHSLIPSGGGGSDPYEAGGYSDTTPSSSGDFDDDSDSISVPSLPSISALGAGAVSLAVISEAELGNFMNYIMNPSFTGLSSISRFFSDPIQAIACLNYMPYTPTNTSGFTLSWGGDDTGASVGAVSAQYEEIDCGSVDLTEFYGSCLDYSPYTTVQLVLPFAGSVDIDPDEFNGKTISVKYHIDNYTGAGLALVSDGDRVLLQVPCSVSNPVPLTSADYSAIIASIANVVMGGVSTIAAVYTGGASVGASVALAGGFAASAAGNVMSAKLHFNHGGSMGMGTGMFGVLKPYLIIKRPRQCLPERNGSFQGYPTFVTENLGDLSGFTKIAEIHLDSIPVTTAERAELMAILKGGVIF